MLDDHARCTCVSPPGGALLSESPQPAWAGRHRVVLLEGIRLLLSEGDHHDDPATQLQAAFVAVATERFVAKRHGSNRMTKLLGGFPGNLDLDQGLFFSQFPQDYRRPCQA